MYLYAVNKSNCSANNKSFCNNAQRGGFFVLGEEMAIKEYSDRLKHALMIRGMDQSELARQVGVKPQAIQYLCRQGKRSVHSVKIAEVLKINAQWLTDGIGEMETTPVSIGESLNAHGVVWLGRFIHVPVIGAAKLVDDSFWGEIDQPAEIEGGDICYPTQDKDAYAIRCDGDSMSPRIQDGEFIIIEPNKEPKPGDEVLVTRIDGRVMVKKFLYERDERIFMMSVNGNKSTVTVESSEVKSVLYILGIANRSLFHMQQPKTQ